MKFLQIQWRSYKEWLIPWIHRISAVLFFNTRLRVSSVHQRKIDARIVWDSEDLGRDRFRSDRWPRAVDGFLRLVGSEKSTLLIGKTIGSLDYSPGQSRPCMDNYLPKNRTGKPKDTRTRLYFAEWMPILSKCSRLLNLINRPELFL